MAGIGDLMKLMSQAGKMKEKMAEVQEKAKLRIVKGQSGGGLVTAAVNGAGEVVDLKIDPEALKDPESLGPLIAAAINVAVKRTKEDMVKDMQEAMGGIDIPPGMLGV